VGSHDELIILEEQRAESVRLFLAMRYMEVGRGDPGEHGARWIGEDRESMAAPPKVHPYRGQCLRTLYMVPQDAASRPAAESTLGELC
jgi:hypothetical protein